MTAFRAGYSQYNWLNQPGVFVEADTEALNAPAANVISYEVGVPWTAINLSLTGGAATLTARLGAARAVECLGFVIPERVDDASDLDFQPAMRANDGVRWRLSSMDDPVTVGDVFDSDLDLPAPLDAAFEPELGVHGFILPDGPLTAARVDLTITLASVPSPPFDLFHIGRVWAGPFTRFLVNWTKGTREWGWARDDLDHRVRRWTAEFGAVRDSEIANLQRVAQQVGRDRQIFWWPREADPSEAFVGRFREDGSFRHKYNNAQLWTPSVQEDWLGV